MSDYLFNKFWLSGIRKMKRKKAKPLFNRVLKNRDKDLWETPEAFTEFLILDIKARLNTHQLGFAEMHPTTYLNGERWDDEIVPVTYI